ncbi:hypothetical protein D018_1958A, partial [Vibrio parahaemolyticus VP2007-007]
MLESLKIDS